MPTRLQPFLDALGVPRLSQAAQQVAVPTEGFSGSSILDPIVKGCITQLQRYIYHCRPDVFRSLPKHFPREIEEFRCALQMFIESVEGMHFCVIGAKSMYMTGMLPASALSPQAYICLLPS